MITNMMITCKMLISRFTGRKIEKNLTGLGPHYDERAVLPAILELSFSGALLVFSSSLSSVAGLMTGSCAHEGMQRLPIRNTRALLH